MSEERPEEQTEEVEEVEDDPYAKLQWAPDPAVPSSQDSVNSAGLYADTLRRGAGVEAPSPIEVERSGIPLAHWMYRSDRNTEWSPERVAQHRQNKTDKLLYEVENFDNDALGFRDPNRPTGYKPESISHRVALQERVYPDELREAMKERIEEIAETPRAELGQIPTMDEIREEVLFDLRRKKRLDPAERLTGQWGPRVTNTLPSDPFDPFVPKAGTPIPGLAPGMPRFMNKSAEIMHNLFNRDNPILIYDPERRERRRERHEASHRVLDRAKESPGYATAQPIHTAFLQEKLRRGEFPNISMEDLEEAVDTTLEKFTAEYGFMGFGSPKAPIQRPEKEIISETDPYAAHGQMLRGAKGTQPTSEDWPESVQNLYSSIRGEEREEGVGIGEEAAFDWTEELAFLDALYQVIAQKARIEGSISSEAQGEALLQSLEQVMRQRATEATRKEHTGQ